LIQQTVAERTWTWAWAIWQDTDRANRGQNSNSKTVRHQMMHWPLLVCQGIFGDRGLGIRNSSHPRITEQMQLCCHPHQTYSVMDFNQDFHQCYYNALYAMHATGKHTMKQHIPIVIEIRCRI
jgi:hypothetical protein